MCLPIDTGVVRFAVAGPAEPDLEFVTELECESFDLHEGRQAPQLEGNFASTHSGPLTQVNHDWQLSSLRLTWCQRTTSRRCACGRRGHVVPGRQEVTP